MNGGRMKRVINYYLVIGIMHFHLVVTRLSLWVFVCARACACACVLVCECVRERESLGVCVCARVSVWSYVCLRENVRWGGGRNRNDAIFRWIAFCHFPWLPCFYSFYESSDNFLSAWTSVAWNSGCFVLDVQTLLTRAKTIGLL